MEPSREGDKRPREGQVAEPAAQPNAQGSGGAGVAPAELPVEHFAPDDDKRAERLAALDGQTSGFLSEVGRTADGYGELSPAELRALQRDARERENWPQAQSDVFRGIIRLGNPVPPRSRRVL